MGMNGKKQQQSSRKMSTSEIRLVDLVYCGSENIERTALHGLDVPVAHVNPYTRRMLCTLLDRADPMGRDWSILAFLLGLQDFLPKLESMMSNTNTNTQNNSGQSQQQQLVTQTGDSTSKCESILAEWCRSRGHEQASVRQLLAKINDLGRVDVYDMICHTIEPFRMRMSKDSGIQNSSQTLASLK